MTERCDFKAEQCACGENECHVQGVFKEDYTPLFTPNMVDFVFVIVVAVILAFGGFSMVKWFVNSQHSTDAMETYQKAYSYDTCFNQLNG